MMDKATEAAFDRVATAIMRHPLYALAPADAETKVREAVSDGIDVEEARKIVRAIDTPQERETILGYIKQVGAAESDVLALLTWLYNACRDALAAPAPAREFGIRPLWSESRKEFKCSGACVEADGTVVMGVYGNDAPRNRCEIWHDGRKVFPVRGFYDAETLFPYPGGRIVAENGFMLERPLGAWQQHSYQQTRCRAKWAACMAGSRVYNAPNKSKIEALDFTTGAKLGEIEGTDVPHDAAVLPDGAHVIAVENFGVVYNDGRKSIRCKPRALIVLQNGETLVGDAGHVRVVRNGRLEPYLIDDPVLGEVVDSFYEDDAGIWLTTSNEDGVWLIPTGSRRAVKVALFQDGPQGGSVFGCIVTGNGIKRVFIRNIAGRNSWEAFEIVPSGGPVPAPKPPEAIVITDVRWHGPGSLLWPVTSGLRVSVRDDGISFEMDNPPGGECSVCAIVTNNEDGGLDGGAYDGLGTSMPKPRAFKSFNNLFGYIDGKRTKGGPYFAKFGPHRSDEERSRRALQIGRKPFYVLIVSHTQQVRTEICRVVPPAGVNLV